VLQTVDNTCGVTGTPATVTGTVTHTPGAEPFVLADTDVAPRNCRFTRDWTGTKQGTPNVLP
jgi:hypothetical protein